MKTTIDRAGRVVIPKEIRQKIGLKAGSEVEIRCSDGVIEVLPVLRKGQLVWEGSVLVWHPMEGAGTVTGEEISRMIEDDREERIDEITRRAGL